MSESGALVSEPLGFGANPRSNKHELFWDLPDIKSFSPQILGKKRKSNSEAAKQHIPQAMTLSSVEHLLFAFQDPRDLTVKLHAFRDRGQLPANGVQIRKIHASRLVTARRVRALERLPPPSVR